MKSWLSILLLRPIFLLKAILTKFIIWHHDNLLINYFYWENIFKINSGSRSIVYPIYIDPPLSALDWWLSAWHSSTNILIFFIALPGIVKRTNFFKVFIDYLACVNDQPSANNTSRLIEEDAQREKTKSCAKSRDKITFVWHSAKLQFGETSKRCFIDSTPQVELSWRKLTWEVT